jgi:hypothetical protein
VVDLSYGLSQIFPSLGKKLLHSLQFNRNAFNLTSWRLEGKSHPYINPVCPNPCIKMPIYAPSGGKLSRAMSQLTAEVALRIEIRSTETLSLSILSSPTNEPKFGDMIKTLGRPNAVEGR